MYKRQIKKSVRDLIAISKAAIEDKKSFEKDPESMDAKELEKLAKELFIFYDSSSSNCQFFSADIAAPRFLLNMQS